MSREVFISKGQPLWLVNNGSSIYTDAHLAAREFVDELRAGDFDKDPHAWYAHEVMMYDAVAASRALADAAQESLQAATNSQDSLFARKLGKLERYARFTELLLEQLTSAQQDPKGAWVVKRMQVPYELPRSSGGPRRALVLFPTWLEPAVPDPAMTTTVLVWLKAVIKHVREDYRPNPDQ
jgi:hypothetical protein